MKVGTLFSGIGAPEMALKKFPHKIVFACDNNPNAEVTYKYNYSSKYFYNNVTKIKKLPNVDLLIFGFPCQPFSFSGHQLGFDDERGTLVKNVISLMKKNPPDFFIAENVKGLVDINKGKLFNIIISMFQDIGYNVTYKILDSLNFGIPHKRERVWILGSRNGKLPEIPDTNSTSYPPLKDFLDRNVSDNVWATKSFLKKEKVKKRLSNYKKSYIHCITLSISRNGTSSEYINYVAAVNNAIGEARKPTVKECCRLFGFSENFQFPNNVSQTARYIMLGNTMVVPILSSIIKKLK